MAKSYNLIDEPWIRVQYNNGLVKEVGIRQALMDATQIKDILPPKFRKDTIYLHKVAVYRLLETIVMGAYFKKDTEYAAQDTDYLDELEDQGLYTDVVKNYIDRFYDRFDLFSETHPFLQNIHLKSLHAENSLKHVLINPFVPSGNSNLFGKARSADVIKENVLDQFRITPKEFAYIVLYFGFMHIKFAPTVSSERSIRGNANTFVVLKGKTLNDTICMNIMPLKKSNSDDGKSDKPVWELSDIHEIEEYEMENLKDQELLCTFFPGVSLLGFEEDGVITDIVQCLNKDNKATRKNGSGLAFTDAIAPNLTFNLSTVYAEKSSIFEITGNEKKRVYFNPVKSESENSALKDAWLHCLAATKKDDKYYGCPLFAKPIKEDCEIDIYFRHADSKGMSILECGYLVLPNTKTACILKDENLYHYADQYKEYLHEAEFEFKKCIKQLFAGGHGSVDAKNIQTNAGRAFSEWVDEDFFGLFTDKLSENPAEAVAEAKERIMEFVLSLFDELSTNMDIFEYATIRNRLYGALENKKNNKEKEKAS